MISGKVKTVIMLLTAVSDTDNATSPPANFEKIFDELPPGEHAINMIPRNITGSGQNTRHRTKAINGNINNCPNNPAIKGAGLFTKALKSTGDNVNPRSNINKVSIGRTINTGFISFITEKYLRKL